MRQENGRSIGWPTGLQTEERAAGQIPPLLGEMCRFFRDEDLDYSIFFRKEPFDISNSGTGF